MHEPEVYYIFETNLIIKILVDGVKVRVELLQDDVAACSVLDGFPGRVRIPNPEDQELSLAVVDALVEDVLDFENVLIVVHHDVWLLIVVLHVGNRLDVVLVLLRQLCPDLLVVLVVQFDVLGMKSLFGDF